MKPYTYTKIVGTEVVSQSVIDKPGGPAPAKQLDKEYTSLAHQLREETWNLMDATIKQPYGIERAERSAKIEHNI